MAVWVSLSLSRCFNSAFSTFRRCYTFPIHSRRSMMYYSSSTVHFVDMRIPDKWRDYTRCGSPIDGERIIALKTPLSEQYNSRGKHDNGILRDERFTPRDAVEIVKSKTRQTLGLVIDLTNTDRYYKSQDFTREGVDYLKIKCEGHQVPSENVYKRLKFAILKLFKDDETALVGIHCTHGLNRTGYLVCRYLIEVRGYKPQDAIHAFNKGRGYAIERINYLQSLHKLQPSQDPVEPVVSSAEMDTQALKKWFKYSTCGKEVKNEKLIPFKTPLSHKFFCKYEQEIGFAVNPEDRLTPGEVCNHIMLQNQTLGLVIDLSPYIKSYNSKEFTSKGIDYMKIKCPSAIPDEDFITRIQKAISVFFDKCPDGLIGIHCVYGVNLTGYVICRYLIDCKGYSPTKAIQAFFHARGYSIEDINMLEKLNSCSPSTPPTNDHSDPRDSKKPHVSRDLTSRRVANSEQHRHPEEDVYSYGYLPTSSNYWESSRSYRSDSQLEGYSGRIQSYRSEWEYPRDSYTERRYGAFDGNYQYQRPDYLERNRNSNRERDLLARDEHHWGSINWEKSKTYSKGSSASQFHTQSSHYSRHAERKRHGSEYNPQEHDFFEKKFKMEHSRKGHDRGRGRKHTTRKTR